MPIALDELVWIGRGFPPFRTKRKRMEHGCQSQISHRMVSEEHNHAAAAAGQTRETF
jgi:hypothetical protein